MGLKKNGLSIEEGSRNVGGDVDRAHLTKGRDFSLLGVSFRHLPMASLDCRAEGHMF